MARLIAVRLLEIVLAGLVPAIPMIQAVVPFLIGIAGTSPAMTLRDSVDLIVTCWSAGSARHVNFRLAGWCDIAADDKSPAGV
jgi:hypothetical protein